MTSSFPDAVLGRLSDFVAARMGLCFAPDRWPELQRGIEAASVELGFDDASSYAQWLMSNPLDRKQIDILAGNLTVGETYFFRDKGFFDVLEEQILSPLLRLREGGIRRLRIWSAACCTGEEPYSLAILLHQIIPNPKQWNITLLASDINPHFLQKAQAGEFGEWSFRDTPPGVKDRYFRATREGRYAILPEIRDMVTFIPLNLVEDIYPALVNNTNAMDLIVCRNVLMYFTSGQAEKSVRKLALALVEGGWLAVSPSEMTCIVSPSLVAGRFAGATLFRKDTRVSELPEVAPSVSSPCQPLLPSKPVSPKGDAVVAMTLANQGNLAEALTWCEHAIVAEPTEAAFYYLRATILSEQQDIDGAVQSLNRALYLDPRFVLAHFASGNAARMQRQHKTAARHYRNALRILRDFRRDDIVPHSDGLTAGRLKDMITSLIQVEAVP